VSGALHDFSSAYSHASEEAGRAGTQARWNNGCSCSVCRRAHSEAERARGRAIAQDRFPLDMRRQFLDALYSGQPFRETVRDLGLTPNQVWGLTRTDNEWRSALETALTATRRDDLRHGTNAAYVHGCVCSECREHQRERMARNKIQEMTRGHPQAEREFPRTLLSSPSAWISRAPAPAFPVLITSEWW
jgi:hypothetical protein